MSFSATPGFERVIARSGKAFLGGIGAGPVAAQFPMSLLINTSATVDIYVYSIIVTLTGTADTAILRQHNASIGVLVNPSDNKDLNNPAPVAGEIRQHTAVALTGTNISRLELLPSVPFQWLNHGVPIILGQNESIICARNTVNTALRATFEWLEL